MTVRRRELEYTYDQVLRGEVGSRTTMTSGEATRPDPLLDPVSGR